MIPILSGVAYALSRKLVEHQDRPVRDAKRVPLWRLLLDELRYLTGRTRKDRRS